MDAHVARVARVLVMFGHFWWFMYVMICYDVMLCRVWCIRSVRQRWRHVLGQVAAGSDADRKQLGLCADGEDRWHAKHG
jgi:hypothetical protein